MTVKEYTEKIEHFFSKHKHRWFDFFNGNDPSRKDAERALLSPIKESISSLLKTVRIYESDLPGVMAEKVKGRIESLEKAIEETAKRLDTSNDPAILKEYEDNAGEDKDLRSFERDGKKMYFKEVRSNQSEQDFGHCLATKLPEIDFWKWYLEEKFEQFEQPKKDEPPAADGSKKDLPTDQPANNPLSKLSQRQLALLLFYRQEAGEVDRFKAKEAELQKIADETPLNGKKRGMKNLQKAFNAIAHPKTGKDHRHEPKKTNMEDHAAILECLKDFPNAWEMTIQAISEIEKNT